MAGGGVCKRVVIEQKEGCNCMQGRGCLALSSHLLPPLKTSSTWGATRTYCMTQGAWVIVIKPQKPRIKLMPEGYKFQVLLLYS